MKNAGERHRASLPSFHSYRFCGTGIRFHMDIPGVTLAYQVKDTIIFQKHVDICDYAPLFNGENGVGSRGDVLTDLMC